MHEIQGAFGYVPWDAMEIVAEEMKIPMAQIYSVLTFYNHFKLKAPGKVVISICDGTACHIKGGQSVIEAFEKELGVKALKRRIFYGNSLDIQNIAQFRRTSRGVEKRLCYPYGMCRKARNTDGGGL